MPSYLDMSGDLKTDLLTATVVNTDGVRVGQIRAVWVDREGELRCIIVLENGDMKTEFVHNLRL